MNQTGDRNGADLFNGKGASADLSSELASTSCINISITIMVFHHLLWQYREHLQQSNIPILINLQLMEAGKELHNGFLVLNRSQNKG